MINIKRASGLWRLSLSHRKSRHEIIHEHNSSLNLHEAMINRLYVDRRGLIDYEDSPNRNHRTSENELLEKDRLTINQLCLNKSHDGEFLLCRVVGGSFQMLAVVTIVEDTEGQVERLMLYNWTNPPDMVEAENLKHRKFIPIGTIMCIKNPKYTIASDGNTTIRCDDAYNVIVMKNHHPILYGIKWNCGPSHKNIKIPNPKLQRYQLNSKQMKSTDAEFSDFSSLAAATSQQSPPSSSSSIKLRSVGDPFPCTNLIQTPSSTSSNTEKQSKRQHRSKRERTKDQPCKLRKRNIQVEFLENPDLSSTIVVCCFIIFLWYVICT